jgi:sec-independent protein translocase protein TatB
MFDVGFSEIVVIAVVALIVIGPERLPKTARTIGHLMGRLQRYVSEVKADIGREMELDELRKLQQQVQTAAHEIQQSVNTATSELESGLKSVENQLNSAGNETTASAAAAPATALPSTEPATTDSPAAPRDERQASLPGFDKI